MGNIATLWGHLSQGQASVWKSYSSAYTKDMHFSHGHGKYLIDTKGVHFQLFHGRETLIRFSTIDKIELVRRHAGSFTMDNFIAKITWTHESVLLDSGFVFAKNDIENGKIIHNIAWFLHRLCPVVCEG
ncbi:MAG: hypothetical protein JKY57_04025 [Kordiimonadaceae bacterium]|nr:hypothetical protein [Kordiimonadaceae bacterium]